MVYFLDIICIIILIVILIKEGVQKLHSDNMTVSGLIGGILSSYPFWIILGVGAIILPLSYGGIDFIMHNCNNNFLSVFAVLLLILLIGGFIPLTIYIGSKVEDRNLKELLERRREIDEELERTAKMRAEEKIVPTYEQISEFRGFNVPSTPEMFVRDYTGEFKIGCMEITDAADIMNNPNSPYYDVAVPLSKKEWLGACRRWWHNSKSSK